MVLAIGGCHVLPPLPLIRPVGVTLIQLPAGELTKKANIGKAGGYLGIITALIAYYCGTAELLGRDGIVELPLGKHQRLD